MSLELLNPFFLWIYVIVTHSFLHLWTKKQHISHFHHTQIGNAWHENGVHLLRYTNYRVYACNIAALKKTHNRLWCRTVSSRAQHHSIENHRGMGSTGVFMLRTADVRTSLEVDILPSMHSHRICYNVDGFFLNIKRAQAQLETCSAMHWVPFKLTQNSADRALYALINVRKYYFNKPPFYAHSHKLHDNRIDRQ